MDFESNAVKSSTVSSTDGLNTFIAEEDGKLITGSTQDVTPHVEYAKAMHRAGNFGTSEFRFAAHFPDIEIEKYCNRWGIDFTEFMQNDVHIKRMMNDSAYDDLRIWKGRV